MRKISFAPEEYYHVYNKGILATSIFRNDRDYARFLFLVLFFQSPLSLLNTHRQVDYFLQQKSFNVDQKTVDEIVTNRLVELVAFAFMPTHFHLLLREVVEGGISLYLQRIAGGYAKYSQIKYGTSGHLFRGPFGATHIEDNNQLLYVSTYLHRNPREIIQWKGREHLYPWSSYPDYISQNRWGKLLKPEVILEQFRSPKEYRSFVNKSIAKDKKFLF